MSESDSHLSYLRHKQGRGKLFDTSEACELSYVDAGSIVKEEGSVWRSRIERSIVTDSLISDSVIKGSVIEHSTIHGGIITASHIACEFVGGNVRISNSTILGKSRVAHSAKLENVHFKNLTVKGSAILRDWPEAIFDGCLGYITKGEWTRPPKVFKISANSTMTESVFPFVNVQCREYEIRHLLRIGNRLGRQCGWTDDEILTIRRALHFLLKRGSSDRR